MNIENLYPFAGNHAVKNATFVIEWTDALSSAFITEAGKLSNKFKALGLESHLLTTQYEVTFDETGSIGADKKQKGPGSAIFFVGSEFSPTGRHVSLSKQNCVINFPDYSRWASVFSDVERYLDIILAEIALASKPIAAIGLQYVDVFSWKDDPAELDLTAVFRQDGFIPPNVFAQKNLWHLHHGFIRTEAEPLPLSLLENVNVDMIDVGGVRTLQVTCSHSATLKDVIWQAHNKNRANVSAVFNVLHDFNKDMLRKLFSQVICDKIKLTVE